jgi:hypothetical protein
VRAHWRTLDARTQEGWLVLSVWAGATFVIFSINSAKLPHYILPMFPALAALLALRWRDETADPAPPPAWVWRALPALATAALLAFALAGWFVFKLREALWVRVLGGCSLALLLAAAWESRKWARREIFTWTAGLAGAALLGLAAVVPLAETDLRSNQTLRPLGLALRREARADDLIVIRHRIPQGLPFYAHPVISAARRPFFSGLPEHRMPFEFPGNRARFGDRVLTNDAAYGNVLTGRQRVLVVGPRGSFVAAKPLARGQPLRLLAEVGEWELFTNH